jgi:hypothetical protein
VEAEGLVGKRKGFFHEKENAIQRECSHHYYAEEICQRQLGLITLKDVSPPSTTATRGGGAGIQGSGGFRWKGEYLLWKVLGEKEFW